MERRCEVCENFRPLGDLKPGRELQEVVFETRAVLLCRAHAGIALNHGARTIDELRELYTEQHGSRSYVPRRARSTRGDQLRGPGRRIGDLR